MIYASVSVIITNKMKIFFLAKIILGKFFLDEANYFDVAIVIFFFKLPL